MKSLSLNAYQLFHDGTLALADVEANGIKIDVPYFQKQDIVLAKTIADIGRKLWQLKEAKEWKSIYKDKTNFNSSTQLSTMLFKRWRYKPTKETRKGNAAVDDEVLRKINSSFTRLILEKRKLTKVKDTYIAQFLRSHTDGFLHPSFNLHLVQTFRSSSDNPNFQNVPVRDPEQGKIIRTGIIPHSPEDIIGEIDFSGIEVRIAACYHKDPAMLEYIHDSSKDMHRDMAAECFLLRPDQVGKKIRYVGKNGFTFPAFYGSHYERIAPSMWQSIDEHKLVTEDGVPIRDHLTKRGIKTLRQFTDHIEKVDQRFWDERFPVFAQWKRDWYDKYLRTGYFDLLTSFRCQGPMRRNEVCNYPVQGTAFHCLLWCLIQLHRWLVANEMETKIIGQIHDSIILNFNQNEMDEVLQKAKKIMTEDIRKHFKWINVPMDIEAELSPVGMSWNDKRKVEIK